MTEAKKYRLLNTYVQKTTDNEQFTCEEMFEISQVLGVSVGKLFQDRKHQ